MLMPTDDAVANTPVFAAPVKLMDGLAAVPSATALMACPFIANGANIPPFPERDRESVSSVAMSAYPAFNNPDGTGRRLNASGYPDGNE